MALISNKLVLIFSFFFALLPSLTLTQADDKGLESGMSAEMLLDLCDIDASDEETLICVAYVRGVLDGLIPFRQSPLHCATWDVGRDDMLYRLSVAHLQLIVEDLSDEILLGKTSSDLSDLSAARFIYWAFTTSIPSADPVTYSCNDG